MRDEAGRSARFNHLTSKKHEWTPARRRTLSCLLVSLLLFSWPLLSSLLCRAAALLSPSRRSTFLLFRVAPISLAPSVKPPRQLLSLSLSVFRSISDPCLPSLSSASRSDSPLVPKGDQVHGALTRSCNLLLQLYGIVPYGPVDTL